jgi:hypothetical protein
LRRAAIDAAHAGARRHRDLRPDFAREGERGGGDVDGITRAPAAAAIIAAERPTPPQP